MPIPAQSVIDRCTALLDAEGGDHYNFANDFKPAINNAQVWLTSLYNRLFGEKKVSEESLAELTVIRVFKASVYSRLSFSNHGVVNSKTLLASAAVDNGDGTTKIPCTAHGFDRGGYVTIAGTTSHDGTFQVETVNDANSFSITTGSAFAAETFSITDTAVMEDKLWTILAVYPSIVTIPTVPTGLPADGQALSAFISDVSMRKPSVPAATRLTFEEWGEKEVNPIIAGSPLITKTNLIRYAYLNMADYSTDAYYTANANLELEIAPDVKNELVAVAYLKQPTDIALVTDSLPFPKRLEELITMKVLNFLAIKDDDREDIYNVSDGEVTKAMQLLI